MTPSPRPRYLSFMSGLDEHFEEGLSAFITKSLERILTLERRLKVYREKYPHHPELAQNIEEDIADCCSREDLKLAQARRDHLRQRAAIEALPPGTPVVLTGTDPYWDDMGDAFPAQGIRGVISSRDGGYPDKQVVQFTRGALYTGNYEYQEEDRDDDPICLKIPRDCFQAVEVS